MEKYYRIIDRNLKRIIDAGKIPVLFPMGKAGIYAKSVLKARYGREGIYVDNEQCAYSDGIISFEKLSSLERNGYSVIVCTIDKKLEMELLDLCIKAEMDAVSIRNPQISAKHDKKDYFKNLINRCAVMDAGCPLVRIGGNADGGYVMLDDLGEIDACLSFGIGQNISWEQGMLKKNTGKIYCYDPMIESLPVNDRRLLFFKQGISGCDSSSGIYKTMKTIINETGIHSDNLILKMDVEGAEWEFIQSTDSKIFSLFKQMTFELHDLTDMSRKEEILECLSKLRETHIPVWVHGNNAGAAEISGNYVVPEMLEITYARKEDYVFSEKPYSCPLSIDFPNISDFNDICLKDWGKCYV